MLSAKLPTITSEMTHPQFRKCRIDWTVFKQITGVPPQQIQSLLYNTRDDTTQHNIINTTPNFLTFTEDRLLDQIETIVTKKVNPTVHRMQFSTITQNERESIRDYFSPSQILSTGLWVFLLSKPTRFIYIRDQLIRGLHNETLQVDILAKAFESARWDHANLQDLSEVIAARTSQYKRQTKFQAKPTPCTGCGSYIPPKTDRQNVLHGEKTATTVTHPTILPKSVVEKPKSLQNHLLLMYHSTKREDYLPNQLLSLKLI